jgi:hypothetical protein
MTYTSLLRQRVTIRRRANTAASDTTDWNQEPQEITSLATGVRCRIDEGGGGSGGSRGEITLPGEAGNVVVDATGYFLAGTDLTEADQVVRTYPTPERTYEVLLVRDAAGQGHHIEAALRLVRQPVAAT